MNKDVAHLIHTITSLENQENGADLVRTLSIIAVLMGEIGNRPSKATYSKKFKLGKLEIDVNFFGMR